MDTTNKIKCYNLRALSSEIRHCGAEMAAEILGVVWHRVWESRYDVLESAHIIVVTLHHTVYAPVVAIKDTEGTATDFQVLQNQHTPEALDVVVAVTRDSVGAEARIPARAWTRWRAADDGTTENTFVGVRSARDRCAFIICLDSSRIEAEHRRVANIVWFGGAGRPHFVFVCPGSNGDIGVQYVNAGDYTVWKVEIL